MRLFGHVLTWKKAGPYDEMVFMAKHWRSLIHQHPEILDLLAEEKEFEATVMQLHQQHIISGLTNYTIMGTRSRLVFQTPYFNRKEPFGSRREPLPE